MNIEIISSKP